ncbi:MAG: cobalamin-dependent protein [Deltaproteobacteria bacterium]|jgi:trimethylamine corrinoid protein|nr:cobalamin-dependent protein [Deltaproteobacteria bacterium]
MSDIYEQAKLSVINHDKAKAMDLAKKHLDSGAEPMDIITNGFVPGISYMGEEFGRGTVFLPELMESADVMLTVVEVVNEAIAKLGGGKTAGPVGSIVAATVQGDVHDIGKGIAVAMFKANGYEVYDLGRDVPVEDLINTAEKRGAKVIATSALLTTTMVEQQKLEKTLKEANLRNKYITLVGGAPVTQRWAKRIGADIYAENAHLGVVLVAEKLKEFANKVAS